MNAAMKIAPAPSLDELKAERTTIRARLAEIEGSRSKLSEADGASEAAERDLREFDARHASRIDEWASTGCDGRRPGFLSTARALIEGTLRQALHTAAANHTAHGTLDAREEQTRRELAGVDERIEAAAVLIMGASLSALADEVIELREETTAAEYRLQAGYDYIRAFPGGVEAAAGVRKAIEIGPFNAGLQAPRPASNGSAVSLAQAAILHAPIDPMRHQHLDSIIKAEFGNLVSGEV